jgi:hypothetical protein
MRHRSDTASHQAGQKIPCRGICAVAAHPWWGRRYDHRQHRYIFPSNEKTSVCCLNRYKIAWRFALIISMLHNPCKKQKKEFMTLKKCSISIYSLKRVSPPPLWLPGCDNPRTGATSASLSAMAVGGTGTVPSFVVSVS